LQAAKASEISSLKLVFPVLAQAIDAKTPIIDFSDFVSKITEFEIRYTFWDACNFAFSKINDFNGSIISTLKTGKTISIELTETEINYLLEPINFLSKNNILNLVRSGGVTVRSGGIRHGCSLTPLPKLSSVVHDSHFKF
jgi:hypothetical protein